MKGLSSKENKIVVVVSWVWLCDPMDCSTPASSVPYHLPEFAQIHVCLWCYLTISSSATHFSFCLQFFPASGSFPMSWLFTWGGKVLKLQLQHQSKNIQSWFPLGLTCLIPLQSKELSKAVTDFIFLSSKITVDSDYSHKIKTLERKLWQT